MGFGVDIGEDFVEKAENFFSNFEHFMEVFVMQTVEELTPYLTRVDFDVEFEEWARGQVNTGLWKLDYLKVASMELINQFDIDLARWRILVPEAPGVAASTGLVVMAGFPRWAATILWPKGKGTGDLCCVQRGLPSKMYELNYA